MQLPETLLAAKLPTGAKTVLTALWMRADGEPAWTAPKATDVADATGMSVRNVKRVLKYLVARGAVRRETRQVGARRLLGFGLSRSVSPLQSRVSRKSPTTDAAGKKCVVKRDPAHRLTIRDDMAAIAKVAGRGDSEEHIARVLLAGKVPCSSSTWYSVKVHRRIALMAEELGITTVGNKAGDIVARWRTSAEREDKRKAAAVEASTPAARIDFSTRDEFGDEPRRKR